MKNRLADHLPLRCINEEKLEDDGFDVKELIVDHFKSLNDREWTRSVGVHHPSALGDCQRARYYDRMGIQPKPRIPFELQALFEVGHALHDRWQRIIGELCEDFEAELLAVDEEMFLSGHCDGVFKVRDWILEIKTIGDASFRRLRSAKKDHVEQAHCYMWAFDVPRVQVLYICRNTGLMKNYKLNFSMEVWRNVAEKLHLIEDHIAEGTMPPQEISAYTCLKCKFFHVCKPEIDD